MRNLLKACGLVLFSLLFVQNGYAQPTPSSLPDTVAGSVSGLVYTVNCDMVQCPMYSDEFLKAVVWDDISGGGSRLFVEFNGTQVGSIAIMPGAYPDVVIGDNMNNPGQEYTVAVTYMANSGQVYIETYNVNLSASPITLTQNVPSPVLLSDPLYTAKFTHIDLFADPNATIGGLPSLHKYVACWEGLGPTYNAVVGDINNIGTPPLTITAINGLLPDVAAIRDINNNTDSACFVYTNNIGGGCTVDVWDVTTGTPVMGSTNTYSASSARIEGMGLYDGTGVKYQGVGESTSGSIAQIAIFNEVIAGTAVYYSAPYTGHYPVTPVVAAGIGNSGSSSGFGNTQYTYSFNVKGSYILAQDIDINTGTPGLGSSFWIVNNSGGVPASGSAPTSIAEHALSSSSNSGIGLLSAFFDGSDIYYKVSSLSSFGFKTTTINKIDTKTGFSVYPNPATDYINVNAPAGYGLTIMDATGKIYIQAKSTGKPLDITALAPGLYFVEAHNNNNRQVIKFTKE